MSTMHPYLGFDGNCREVFEFYQKCIGGDLQFMTYGDSQMADSAPNGDKNQIMHAYLKSGNFIIMGSDMGQGRTKDNTVSLCMVGETKGEIEAAFEKLREGATIGNELTEEFFGTYGDLKDKYGFYWMFQYSPKTNNN